jgi:putative ABC transport system substrate-binding protein
MPVKIRRRDFVAAFASAATTAFPVLAQQSERMRRIGVLMSAREEDRESDIHAATLRKGLAELGWAEGRNLQFDFRWAGGDEGRASAYAAELVKLRPDLIITISTLCLKVVRNETSTIPIVFTIVGDPVGQDFISNLAHPGSNITGFGAFEFEIGSKWLELAKLIAPQIKRVAFIFNPEAGPYAEKFMQSIAKAAPSHGVELTKIPLVNAAEMESIVARVGSESNSALIVNPDAFITVNRGLIISLAARYRLPAVYPYKFFAVEGGLLSYGHEREDSFRRAAIYVDRIFKGARPGDLPVQNPTQFELIINKKTANALGLIIPDKLLSLADETIE